MEPDGTQNAKTQNGMRDARTHVNRQKTRRGIEPPRTVAEQVEELVVEGDDGRRRRDPVGAAEAQRTERDNGVGGAWIDTTQRANEPGVDEAVFFEKLPERHAERAERHDDA
ncbi:MAG: hypothetical protein JWM98_43 [Thermoleophilia bacterium]|nr:hypothetical protein [Thermoleophilia bacterium]